MIPHHNSTVLAKQLINFLLERYNPVADLDGVYTFVDANSLKDAHKIMYMEVSPKGYYNYISIIYKVNTSKWQKKEWWSWISSNISPFFLFYRKKMNDIAKK